MTRRSIVFAAALAALLFSSCQADEKSALGVAERFVDQHYVQIDLAAARPFCVGPALKKVEDEQRLTQGATIDDSTRKPTVHYRVIEQKDEGERATFVFQGTISVADGGDFTRKWLISTRREGNQWKVSNFEEFD